MRGVWRLDDGRALSDRPYPGIPGVATPLQWFDTLAVGNPADAGWNGFEAALSAARGVTADPPESPDRRRHSRADVSLSSGSEGYTDNSLSVRGNDDRGFVWVEAASFNLGATGALERAGRHLYDVVAARTFDEHRISGTFAHRGMAGKVRGGEETAVAGNGGEIAYRFEPERYRLAVSVARAHDAHESFGPSILRSRRDAQDVSGTVELARRGDSGEPWAAHARWSRAEVRRATNGVSVAEGTADALWAAGRWRRSIGEGALMLELGLGRHEGVDRSELAPSASYEFTGAPFAGRVVIERVMAPVWTDLAAGQSPFLQSTWLGGLEVDGTWGANVHAGVRFLAGRTQDRALVGRHPLADFWLRSGFVADPGDYDFALMVGEGSWGGRHGTLGFEGYALARDGTSRQAAVDPGQGFRSHAEWAFRMFQSDLGVRLRVEAAGVGSRASQTLPSRRLPSYVTYGAAAVLSLADVRLAFRVVNLEDRARPEVWLDRLTGEEALGPGRQFRVAFTWRLVD